MAPPAPRDPEDGDPTTFHVRAAVRGEGASLEWLIDRLSPVLLAHAARRLGPTLAKRCDPRDLVHEAWVVTLPRLASLDARDGRYTPGLLRFLTTTVVQRVYALLKRQAREQLAVDPVRFDESIDPEVSGVVSRILRAERHDAVRRALDGLDPVDRDIVLLRGVEQATNAAVAAQVGLSIEAVSKRYRRALAGLRARLPGSVFDELGDGA